MTYLSLLASLVISLPAIVSVVLFHVKPPPTPLIFLAKEGLGNSRELVVISSTVPSGFTFSPSHDPQEGFITNNCNQSFPIQTDFLVINLTHPLCTKMLEDERAMSSVIGSGEVTVVLLDDADARSWRVSSPDTQLAKLFKI